MNTDTQTEQPLALRSKLSSEVIEKLALSGDVSGLTRDEKVQYYRSLCERVGLDSATQPFKLLKLQGKEVFYCDRSGAQQLSRLHNVTHEVRAREIVNDCYVVTVRASANGRSTESIGAVPIANLKGEALCNAYMKAETKGKRRATLDLLGLGMLDESEISSIPGAQVEALNGPVARVPASPPVQTPQTPKNAAATPSRPNDGKREATPETRAKMLKELEPYGEVLLHEYAVKSGTLLETEDLSDWPLSKVPTDWGGLRKLKASIEEFRDGGAPPFMDAPAGYTPPVVTVREYDEPISAGTRTADDQPDDVDYGEGEPLPKDIAGVIVPVPRKGQSRDEYLKNPQTIGSLYAARHGTDDEAQEARQRLWGFVHNYEAKPWTGKDGKERPPSASDVKFREALDQFAEWFQRAHPDEKL